MHYRSHESTVCRQQSPERIAQNQHLAPNHNSSDELNNQHDQTSMEISGGGDINVPIVEPAVSSEHEDMDPLSREPPILAQQSHIFDWLDSQRRVADEIYAFYDSLTQFSKPLVPSQVTVMDKVVDLPASVISFLECCSCRSFSRQQATKIHSMFVSRESHLPEKYRQITTHIPRPAILHRILKAFRDDHLHTEGWKRAIIDLNELHYQHGFQMPLNETGTFRCPLDLFHRELNRLGISAVQKFKKTVGNDGKRTFSCPIDGLAMEKYSDALETNALLLYVDIYCDGLALPNGGTQSISPFRVRFSNVKGIETVWFDIGLCPTLQLGNVKCTPTKKAELRRELLHRFMFLILKPMIHASRVGFQIDSTLIYPRLLMVVCDQRQERPLYCLKSAGASRDCTTCDMMSKVTKAELRISPQFNGTMGSDKDSISSSTSSDSISSDVMHQTGCSSSLKRQLDPNDAGNRDVIRTLGAQLLLTVSKLTRCSNRNEALLKKMTDNMSPGWFASSNRDIMHIRQYLILNSCCDLPPLLGAFHGLGTEPYALYDSISFDTLHVIDLGLIRKFSDLCWKHYSAKKFTSLPTARCIYVANERLRQLPRGMHLPKENFFLSGKNEVLPGMTGLIRRLTCPILWICIMGVNDCIDPDNDPLLQTALELNEIHCKLLGINESVDEIHRTDEWITDLQLRCFKLGESFVDLFQINVNTKMHRVMRHINSHLRSFGLVRWGANDCNETKHKTIKAAYKNTNRKPHQLAAQLLKSGYAADIYMESDEETLFPSAIIPTEAATNHLRCIKAATTAELNSHRSFHRRLARLHTLHTARGETTIWLPMAYVTLRNIFPWKVDKHRQYIMDKYTYRGWMSASSTFGPRNDGCIYTSENGDRCGLVQNIIRSNFYKEHTFLVLRRLTEATPLEGNRMVTTKYGHSFYQYAVNQHGGVQLDLVSTDSVLYPAYFVYDPMTTAARLQFKLHQP